MKTFSKVLSMILVGVMCFGLFASSAYAFEFGSSDNAPVAQSVDFGGGDGGFVFAGEENSVDPDIPVASNNADFTFTQEEPAAAATSEEKQEENSDELVFTFSMVSDTTTFDKRYDPADTYTWKITNQYFDKTSPVDVEISSTATPLEADTFDSIVYTTSGSYSNPTTIASSNMKPEAGKIILRKEWLKTLSEGTYYIWGVPALGAPVYIGFVQVNPDTTTYNLAITQNTYKQFDSTSSPIVVKGDVDKMKQWVIVRTDNTSSYQFLSAATDYTISGVALTFDRDFLNSLQSGAYYVVGITSATSTDKKYQVQATGTMIIKAGTGGSINPSTGKEWYLSPDYSAIAWTSGDDYLQFWSDLMALRKYPSQYSVILRYGYGAGSIPTKEVNYNQFWDFDNGNFALGTNFLNSLPSGTYTLGVYEMKYGMCTNTVTFRIGAKLVPIDSDKHVINSIRNLRYLCDDPVSQVYVGNIPLTYGEDYALSADRRTITLSYEFLNKRSAGNTYTIKALTDYGQYCSSTFQILTTAQGGASPRTGDESNLGLWAAFLLLSGTAVVILIPKLKKHGA